MHKPAHKSGTAGQIVNTEELDKMSYKSHPRTLGDVIDNVLLLEKQMEKKKLTFTEWWNEHYDKFPLTDAQALSIWIIAQENV